MISSKDAQDLVLTLKNIEDSLSATEESFNENDTDKFIENKKIILEKIKKVNKLLEI